MKDFMHKLSEGLLSSKYAILWIVLLAVLLRSYQINNPYTELFGWRESSTAMMAANLYEGKTSLLYPMVNFGGPGPNYQGREFQTVTYITSKIYHVFGINDWAGRAVNIFFGIIGLLSIYGLVREVWDKQRAILSALILATLPGSVYLDRTFVPDPAMLGLLSLSLYMTVLYVNKKKTIYFLLAALAACLGVLTKLNGAILIIPGLYIVVSSWKRGFLKRKELGMFLIAAFVVTGVVVAYYLWALYLSSNYPPYHFAGSNKFLSIDKLSLWFEKKYYLNDLYFNLIDKFWTGPVLFLFFIGLVTPVSVKNPFRWVFHYWVLALIIQFVIEAEHLAKDPNNLVLYFPPAAIFSSNFIYKLIANYRENYSVRIVRFTIAMLILVFAASTYIQFKGLFRNYYNYQHQIGNKLRELAPEKDLVISFDPKPIALYYSGLTGWTIPSLNTSTDSIDLWHEPFDPDYAEMDIRLMKEFQGQGAKWLVIPEGKNDRGYSDMELMKIRSPKIHDYLNRNYDLEYQDESGSIFKIKQYN